MKNDIWGNLNKKFYFAAYCKHCWDTKAKGTTRCLGSSFFSIVEKGSDLVMDLLEPPSRTKNRVYEEYRQKWSSLPNVWKLDQNPSLVKLPNGEKVLWRSIDIKKLVLRKFVDLICDLRPTTVIELGSGSGINILALAVMCPFVKKWTGIELVEKGVKMSKEFLKNPNFAALTYLTGESKEKITEIFGVSDIEFRQGDMTDLPLEDNSFDMAITNNTIEQVPGDYMEAFKEIKRIANQAVFIEAFKEAQTFRNWLYLLRKDYFRSSYKEVEKAGFKISKFERLYNKRYTNCLLLCKSVIKNND